jgi:hypothetical protein
MGYQGVSKTGAPPFFWGFNASKQARPSLDMKASQVLTVYHVTKWRKAMHPEQDGGTSTQRQSQQGQYPDDLDDGEPLDF